MHKKSDLDPAQNIVIDHMFEHDHTLALVPMGGGKTVCSATAAVELNATGFTSRWLILGTKRICELVWPKEFPGWEHLQGQTWAVACGTPKQRSAAIESDATFVFLNYENVAWFIKTYNGVYNFDALIIDELTKLKSSSGKGYKAINRHLTKFKVRIGMTGLFTPNGIKDVFGQVMCVDKGASLGRTKEAFKNRFFQSTGPMPWQEEPVEGALEKIIEAIAPITVQMPDSAYVDSLPPLIPNNIVVALPAKARKLYEELEDEYCSLGGGDGGLQDATDLLQNFSTFSDLAPAHLVEDAVEPLVRLYEDMLADGALNLENTGAVSDMLDEFPEMGFHASQALNTIREAFDAILDENLQMIANGGVLVGKLQEIANGFLYNGQPKKGFDLVHEQKLDALDELISSLHGSPLLVAYKFNAEFELLQERFPAPHLGSGINAKQAAETERAWNNSELPLMYVHPASAGHGLNLQYGTCQTICWYAMTWSLEEYDQLTARIRRRGQTASQIRAHHLVCNDTVDEDLLQAVADKADVESAVQGGIRMRNLKRK